MPHQLLGDLFDLPCRHVLQVHFGQRRHEYLWRELACNYLMVPPASYAQ